jgi:hypothetical protein
MLERFQAMRILQRAAFRAGKLFVVSAQVWGAGVRIAPP